MTQAKHEQLSLFSPERLPRKPYCSDHPKLFGLKVRSYATAIEKKYIQPNTPTVRFRSVFDIDRQGGAFAWSDASTAPANWAATNPTNGHAHLGYEIEVPVLLDPDDEGRKPAFLLALLEMALTDQLAADRGYTGFTCKNPTHPHWVTQEFRSRPYSLTELAEYVPNLNSYKKKYNASSGVRVGVGRNVELFDRLRLWAYQAINARRYTVSKDQWMEEVRAQAEEFNQFGANVARLDTNEVKGIAKSVGAWVWDVAPESAVRFARLQAHRGSLRHLKFLEEHGAAAYSRSQSKAAYGAAASKRAKTERAVIEAIGALTAAGQKVSMLAVANALGMSHTTLSKYYRHLFSVDVT